MNVNENGLLPRRLEKRMPIGEKPQNPEFRWENIILKVLIETALDNVG